MVKLLGFRSGLVQPPFGWSWTWTKLSLSHFSDPDPIPVVQHWTGSTWVWIGSVWFRPMSNPNVVIFTKFGYFTYQFCSNHNNDTVFLFASKLISLFCCWVINHWPTSYAETPMDRCSTFVVSIKCSSLTWGLHQYVHKAWVNSSPWMAISCIKILIFVGHKKQHIVGSELGWTGSHQVTIYARPLNCEPYNLWTSLTLTLIWPELWVGSGSWTSSLGSDPNPGHFLVCGHGFDHMTTCYGYFHNLMHSWHTCSYL